MAYPRASVIVYLIPFTSPPPPLHPPPTHTNSAAHPHPQEKVSFSLVITLSSLEKIVTNFIS